MQIAKALSQLSKKTSHKSLFWKTKPETHNRDNSRPTKGTFFSTCYSHTHYPNSTNINMSGTTCLLKTAIAMVGSEQFKAEANILFDEGAQRSFIRQDLVRQLQIKPTQKENVCLSAFGATTPAVRQLDVVTLTLMTDTNEQLTLEALVVPENSNTLPKPSSLYCA